MDPDDRPTAREALESEWIRCVGSEVKDTSVASKQEQESHRAFAQFNRAVMQLLAQELTEDQVMHLRAELEKYDSDGDGLVQLRDFRTVLQQETTNVSSRIAGLFGDEIDMTFAPAYNDFCIKILAERDRTITEKTAEALDELDVEGSRKVDKDQLQAALEGILSPDMLDKILQEVTVGVDGKVSTVKVLEMLDKGLANHTRHSLGTIGSQHDDGDENKDLIDESNAIIPGGRPDISSRKPKYVYEAKNNSMREAEYEA